jgi:hypothetical protein
MGQPRQHEADQSDGVFKFVETHLRDHPRPQPTNQRLPWLAGLFTLHHKYQAREPLFTYFLVMGLLPVK